MNEENLKENPINPAALEAITKDMESLKATRESNKRERHAPSNGAARAAVDFLSAMAVCSIIGFGIDYWLNTSPLGLLIGLLAGAALGAKLMLNDVKRGDV